MAIHSTHAGLSAEVVVNGQPLTEYNDDDEEKEELRPKTVTKYVPAESDANFSLQYTIPKGLNGPIGVRVRLELDDKYILYRTHTHEDIAKRNIKSNFECTTTNTKQGTYTQKFRFSPLSIDENAADLDKKQFHHLQKVGVVSLKFDPINNITQEPQPADVNPEELPLIGTLPEKSLKGDARSHQASFDAPTFRSAYVPKESGFRDVIHAGEPFAIFKFKYRSQAALRVLRLLPRTPSPPPLAPPRRAPKTRKRAQQQSSITRTPKVKQEQKPQVKREAPISDDEVEFVSDKRVKGPPNETDEVIELD